MKYVATYVTANEESFRVVHQGDEARLVHRYPKRTSGTAEQVLFTGSLDEALVEFAQTIFGLHASACTGACATGPCDCGELPAEPALAEALPDEAGLEAAEEPPDEAAEEPKKRAKKS